MFINNFDPVALEIFSLEIRWYSLSYIFGLVFGWYLAKNKMIKDTNQKEYFDDYVTYLIISIILGGRLGYVIFYNLDYYLLFPIKVLFIWEGGMSFHGALLGVLIAIYSFRKSININFLQLTDFIVLYVPIGLFFGRIGNFINSELYGIPTYSSWGVIFPLLDNIPRHPSMLYEALLEGVALFIILLLLSRKHFSTPGFLTSIFLVFYSIFRFMIEFVRVPDSHIGYIWSDWLTLGQLLSVPMTFFGIFLLIKINRSRLT